MKKTIRDIENWHGKRALVREDFNVPFNEQGQISDDTRIREALPTLDYLVQAGARVVVISHMGRPKGQAKPELSLRPVAERLQQLRPQVSVRFGADNAVVSEEVVRQVDALQPGQILVLENVRFAPGEENNDPAFAQQLATLADVYVNDAFGSAHRAHASTEGVTRGGQPNVAGLLMEKEIQALSQVLNSDQPLTAIIGGSKISTKITVLENLLPKVRYLIIGGGMLFTFLRAQGYSVGNSLVEQAYVPLAQTLIEQARNLPQATLILANDVTLGDRFAQDADTQTVQADAIPDGWMGLDIGPESIERIRQILAQSPLVLWNGPLGVFEFPRFAAGTQAVAETLADLTDAGHCQSVLGGGDTVAAIEQFGIAPERFSHVSTGGGASLEFLEGKTLPGIAALDDQPTRASV